MKIPHSLLFSVLVCGASILQGGCVTIADVNAGMYRIDKMWQLEYQKAEDEFRSRIVEADFAVAFMAVRKTFIELGMPVQTSTVDGGTIIAENVAPSPLTLDEWKEIAKQETPRMKEIGGWYLNFSEDPKGYLVIVKATVINLNSKCLVVLDYQLDSPKLRARGVNPPKHAPPLAVKLGALKFWTELGKKLDEMSLPVPRKRNPEEISA